MLKWKRFGWTVKDELARKRYPAAEIKKLILKSMLASTAYPFHYKLYFINCLQKFSKQTSLGFYRIIVCLRILVELFLGGLNSRGMYLSILLHRVI